MSSTAMATFTITLPGPLQQFLERKLAAGGYGSESEYMQALLEAQRREEELEAWEGLRQKVEEGLASGPAIPATEEFWQGLRAELTLRRPTR
jgi:antitoxin ParD1/3/4